jgi:protein-S-isoprenylcysteine O-methyltransferase Ste14
MGTWIRHLLSILALPVMVAIAVPIFIARRNGIALRAPETAAQIAAVALGLLLLAIGLALFTASLRRFATEGQGTLAPWDPPHNLVVRGPYRHVRNPMISGVIFALFAEAVVLRSWPHTAWAAAFLALNLVYIPAVEEPQLEARFGEAYRRYKAHVPRFLPRLSPWEPE